MCSIFTVRLLRGVPLGKVLISLLWHKEQDQHVSNFGTRKSVSVFKT